MAGCTRTFQFGFLESGVVEEDDRRGSRCEDCRTTGVLVDVGES